MSYIVTRKFAKLSPSAQSDGGIPGETIILWNRYAGSNALAGLVSLPDAIEQRSDAIRSQVLAFVHETGKKSYRDKTIIETLKIRDSFSWWWMTLFALRRWHDDSNLYELAKIYALRDVLIERQITNLQITEIPDDAATAIESLCDSLGIEFQDGGVGLASTVHPQIYNKLPSTFQAFAVLVRTVFASSTKKSAEIETTGGLCFFDYLNGLDLEKYKHGVHVSRYWGAVTEIAESSNKSNSWFHLFTPSSTTPTPQIAIRNLNRSKSPARESHYLLSGYVNLRVVFLSLLVYLKICRASVMLGSKDKLFIDTQTGIDFTDLFRHEWVDSLRGRTAMHHAILFCSIEDQLRKLPPQNAAFFVMENQPWEMALIYVWKRFQSSPIIGIPHAAAKFWELRHFVDPCSRSAQAIHKFPEPDMIGVNSPFMRNLLEDNSFPPERIIDLEAAGFTHLYISPSTKSGPRTSLLKSTLIFGDYDRNLTMSLLDATTRSLSELGTQTINIFRPHPMCVVTPEILSKHGLMTNGGSISDQLEVADLVIAPSSTSAAVEAFCLGIPVVILLGTSTFNFSPLRNMDGVFFASDEKSLSVAIASASAVGRTNPRPYFNIDPIFTSWRSLLEGLQ